MGFNNVDILKEEDEFIWRGDKNLHIYENEFEKYLIDSVFLDIFLFYYRVVKNTKRNAFNGETLLTALSTWERLTKI